MSAWLTGSSGQLAATAGKAALMYGTALVGLRLGERRTLAQWSTIDFAAAVAIGAIVGRTAVAGSQSYAVGAVALVTLIVLHRLLSLARFSAAFGRLVDHRIRLLVVDGRVQPRQLRVCGLTEGDLFAHLREQGYRSLHGIRYVLYEAKGGLTVVPAPATAEEELVERAVAAAPADTPPAGPARSAASSP